MDREPSLSPSGHALTTDNSPPLTSARDNLTVGIGPRLLGISIPDSSNHSEQKDDSSNLTKAQIYRKKNYMKLRTNEKAWEEYKIKRNEYRNEKRKGKTRDIERMYEARKLKLKMKQNDKEATRLTRTTTRTNARSRFFKNFEKGIATKEDLKKYMDLLERDKNYQKLSRQRKKNAKQNNKRG